MPLLRGLCSLMILAFVLGTILPVPSSARSHEMPELMVSAVEHSMTAGCDDSNYDSAMQMLCAKVFCAGSAMILSQALEGYPEAINSKFGLAPNQNGSGILPLLDPDPPRSIVIG